MHIADITEDVESLNIAIMHNLDEHMEAEKLIEIIIVFWVVYLTGTEIFLSRDIG